jgi:hypothetical protein
MGQTCIIILPGMAAISPAPQYSDVEFHDSLTGCTGSGLGNRRPGTREEQNDVRWQAISVPASPG